MHVTLLLGKVILVIMCAYALQTDLREGVKDEFWDTVLLLFS